MNHPLVRRKFRATFFFSSLESGSRVWRWGRGKCRKGVAVWRYTVPFFPAFSRLAFRRFAILSSSFSLPCPFPRIQFFFFHISRVTFFRILTSLIRFPLSTVFSLRIVFFLSFFAPFFLPLIFPSSRFLPPASSFHISLRDRVGNWGGYKVDLRSPQGDNYL